MLSFDYNVLDRLLLLDVSDGLWSSFSSCPPSNPRLPASSWFWKPITHDILSANSSLTCFVWYRLIIQENTRILVIQRKGVPGKKILQSPPNIYQEGTKYLFCLIRYKKNPTEIELWSPFPRSQEERKDVHQYIIPMWPSLLVGSRCADYDLTFKGSDD